MLSMQNISMVYRTDTVETHALREFSLEVAEGDFVAVTGPSGSGKTTFLNIAGMLERFTSGRYVLDGKDVSKLSKDDLAGVRNQKIGFVFQEFNLLTRTTALDNVELPLLYNNTSGLKAADRHKRAMASLEIVGLGERFHHMPNQLSGGQQQRVAIARALINEPSILLADEPTGNLDTRTSIEVMGIFQRLNKERGITVIVITHEMDIAEYGTRLIRFRDGRVVADQAITHRRNAADELAALPPPEPDQIETPAEAAH
jgi:putative ABC transport system ATP-binding protein